jgi:hypothetical protein
MLYYVILGLSSQPKRLARAEPSAPARLERLEEGRAMAARLRQSSLLDAKVDNLPSMINLTSRKS